MDTNPITRFSEFYNSMVVQHEEKQDKLKNDFILILEKLNKRESVVKVQEQGLPSHIFVSSDMFLLFSVILSRFAKITENKYTDKEGDIVLVWGNAVSFYEK